MTPSNAENGFQHRCFTAAGVVAGIMLTRQPPALTGAELSPRVSRNSAQLAQVVADDDAVAWAALRSLSLRTSFAFLAGEPDLYTLSDGER